MLINSKIFSLILILVIPFITSCSNTRILVEGTKKIISKDEKNDLSASKLNSTKFTKGHYKIGRPYIVDNIEYYPKLVSFYNKEGIASWYGPKFDKKLTANGEIFDQNYISAAHKTLPLPSIVKVINLENNKELFIRVNDRGPFVNNRIIDLSKEAAIKLNIFNKGTENVQVILIDSGPHLLNIKYLNHKYLTSYSIKKEKTTVKNKNISSFFIQLGAFSNFENAKNFIKKIKNKLVIKEDIKILKTVKTNQLFKIVVGPFKEDSQLKNVADKLLELGYNFIVINEKESL